MKKIFDHTFPFAVWRLVPSSSSEISWAVELRSAQQKTVNYYFCQPDASPLKLELGLDWWSGIEVVLGNLLVLHGFAQPDLPIHQGIIVADGNTGNIKWQDEYLIFESADEATLKAKIPTGAQQTLFFELNTGNELSEDISLAEPQNEVEPIVYLQEHPNFPQIVTFIHSLTEHEPVKLVEYFETNENLVLSYFTSYDRLIDNYILVTDNAGEILLHDRLVADQKGIAKGTFMVSNGLLSFVKDKQQVVVYSF